MTMYFNASKYYCILFYTLLAVPGYTQSMEKLQIVAITPFSADSYEDSIAAKYAYDAVVRTFVQTKRFNVLEPNESKRVLEELERQKSAASRKQPIIESGYIPGADIVAIGTIKTAGICRIGTHYIARVDYELKFVDVRTGKSIAASYFPGDSDSPPNARSRKYRGLKRYIPDSAVSIRSEAVRDYIKPILIDAVESTTAELNIWVRAAFNCNLSLLKLLEPSHKKRPSLLIEGGKNMGIDRNSKLRLVYIKDYYDQGRKIRDEAPIAELKIKQVSDQTTRCKVVKFHSREGRPALVFQPDSIKIVFK